MPQATFKSVHAVSSEDPAHPAANLLKIQSGKKWKTLNVGEKSAYVVLQLDQAHRITGIDVGNEHSAFAEVLVGKLGCSQDDFKEILLTCSFMTPIESKNSSNQNRVRCFAQNALVQSVADQKWELIKVVCTQPFNRHVQYGLSFIKIHVAESKDAGKDQQPLVPQQSSSTARQTHMGKFSLREDSPDSESEGSLSLFTRWKQTRNSPGNKNLSTAAAIREASSPYNLKTHSESLKPMKIVKKVPQGSEDETVKHVLDRNRNDLLFGDEDEVPNERLEKRLSQDQEGIKRESNKHSKKEGNSSVSSKKDVPPSTSKPNSQKRSISPSPSNSTLAAKKLKTEQRGQFRPFNELLKGVILVISGIQNPDRAELRRKALEMGAKYKPDWDSTCTHLICAFKNTPKYNQVKGKGKIVAKEWIGKCYSLKKRLPWRRYALDDKEGEAVESEDEICDLSLRPTSPEPQETSPPKDNPSRDATLASNDLSEKDLAVQSDIAMREVTSGSDTEEEIEKVRKMQQEKTGKTSEPPDDKKQASLKKEAFENAYEVSTDEEDYTARNKTNWTPPQADFFADRKFFLSDELDSRDVQKLRHHIKTYGGELVTNTSRADFIISNEPVDVPDGFKGEMVKPRWIYECHDLEGWVPTRRYRI